MTTDQRMSALMNRDIPIQKDAEDALARAAQLVLSTRARSFRWGQVLLPDGTARDVALCYAFCRLLDDAADEAPDDATARRDLAAIERELAGDAPARPIVAAYRALERRFGIDADAARELLRGVSSDVGPLRVEDDAELLRYAYRVAGTVGVMMCGILGVREGEALPHAVDLGIGMQLSNICRDVAEDATLGRVYLPAQRLRAVGVEPEALVRGDDVDREALFSVVRDLIVLSERYYESAEVGMRYIPPRARVAILVAARLYRAIGLKVMARGPVATTDRTVVGPWAKLGWSALALGAAARSFAAEKGAPHPRELHVALKGLPGVSA